jgi:hypothetical protein
VSLTRGFMRLQHVLDAADIGIAGGVVMERDRVDRRRPFAFLVRLSNNPNVKLRALAHQVIDGTCESTPAEVRRQHGCVPVVRCARAFRAPAAHPAAKVPL